MEWKKKDSAGNRNITIIEGIDLVVSERLSEAGIDTIQQIAFCNPDKIATETKFDAATLSDWKDQALLYLFTNNVTFSRKDGRESLPLNEILEKKLGIRVYSEIRNVWFSLNSDANKIKFIRELGLICTGTSEIQLLIMFNNITQYIDPFLKSPYQSPIYSPEHKVPGSPEKINRGPITF
jgi:hypothetical protein